MDIDISDILADVSRPPASSTSLGGHAYDLNSTAYTDHQLLVRAWTSERTSPSLLPYPAALVNRVMTRIRDQITRIEDMTSGINPSDPYSITATTTTTTTTTTSSGAGSVNKPHNQNTNLTLSILQTDLSRTQFIVRSYLRQRLTKITKYTVYWLKHHVESAPSPDDNTDDRFLLLSPAETAFLKSHQALLSEFYDSSFLSSFPPNLRRLDDSSGGVNMVEGPDGGAGVVVRCLATTWDNVDHLNQDGSNLENEIADVELNMRRNEIWVVRWRDVRTGVVKGDLELL